jgi:hypothetical protein
MSEVSRVEASFPDRPEDIDWFSRGWAVYKGDLRDSEHFPSLNDMEAQRWWLGGLGAAWADTPDDEAIESILDGDGMGGESVEDALARALEGRAALLRQLRAHSATSGRDRAH